MAIDSSGRTWGWGWNAVGQLGDGTTIDRPSPTMVAGGEARAVALSGGWYHSAGAFSVSSG